MRCPAHSPWWLGGIVLVSSVSPRPGLAQEVIEVPAIEVEAVAPRTDTPSEDRATVVTDPAGLDAPTGPARELLFAPSVAIREAGGIGHTVSLQVRGADPASTLAALEGVPLNSPFLGGADLSGLALLPLESLTLVRGGQSAAWGSDAVGGVLEARLPSPTDNPGSRLSWTLGSFGTVRMKVAHAERAEALAGLVALGLLSSAGDFPFTDTNGRRRTRSHNAASALDALAKAEATWAQGRHRAVLLIEGYRDDREIPGLEQFPSQTARQGDSRLLVSARWEGPPLVASEGRTGVHLYVRRLGFAFEDEAPPMGPAVKARLVAWEVSGEGLGEEALSRAWRFPWSIRVTHTRGQVERAEQPFRAPTRSLVACRAGAAWDQTPFRIEAAARIEWDEGFGVTVLPRADVRVTPWPFLSVFASAARSFRLPNFEELYFNAGFVQGNPGLRPEDALTWDAGVAISHKKTARLQAAYFENRVANLILFLPRSAFLIRAENSGSARFRGVEVEGSLRLGPVGLRAAYTYLDARLAGGLAMPHRPRHTVAGDLGLDLHEVRIAVRGRGQTAMFMDRYESLREEGRLFVDARIEWSPTPKVALALDAHNLLDKRDAVDSLQSPLPGRAFYASLWVSL